MGIDSLVLGSEILIRVVLSFLNLVRVVCMVVFMLVVRLVLKNFLGMLMCRFCRFWFSEWVKFFLGCCRLVELCLLKLVMVFNSRL